MFNLFRRKEYVTPAQLKSFSKDVLGTLDVYKTQINVLQKQIDVLKNDMAFKNTIKPTKRMVKKPAGKVK